MRPFIVEIESGLGYLDQVMREHIRQQYSSVLPVLLVIRRSHVPYHIEELSQELQSSMEVLDLQFFLALMRSFFVQCRIQVLKVAQLQGSANQRYVNAQRHLRHLQFLGLLLGQGKQLFLAFFLLEQLGFPELHLLFLLLPFISLKSAHLEHEGRQLEVVVLVELLDVVLVLGKLREDLLNQGAVGVLQHVHQVHLQGAQQTAVVLLQRRFIDQAVVLGRFNQTPLVFDLTTAWSASLGFLYFIDFDVFLVDVGHNVGRAIVSEDLKLSAELGVSESSHEVDSLALGSLPGFDVSLSQSFFLFEAEYLLGREVLEYLVPYFQEVDGDLLEKGLAEVLRHKYEGVQGGLFCEYQQQSFLQAEVGGGLLGVALVRDLQQLLEEDNNELNHLLVLLIPLLLLQAISEVLHQHLDHLRLGEEALVLPQAFVVLELFLAVLGGQFRQLHDYHGRQEGQALVLLVKNQQVQQIFLHQSPLA